MVRPMKAWEKFIQLGIAAVAVVVTGDASAKAVPAVPAPASALASCRITASVLPTQTEIETLQTLMQTYQVSAPRLKPSGVKTRCEFAHALELTLLQFSDLIAKSPGAVSKATLETVNRLYASYHTEVTSQPYVEALLADLPDRLTRHRLFSTDTVLCSEGCSLEPKLDEPPDGKVPAVLADVQALQAILERYHSTVIFFHQEEQINRSEFADALNAFGNWTAPNTVIHQEDLTTLQRLRVAYTNELASTRAYLAQVEERVRRHKQQKAAYEAKLALWDRLRSGLVPFDLKERTKQQLQRPFSPTTKLSGEWIIEPQFNEPPLSPLPPLPQNGKARAALADLQALEALTARHGCIVGLAVDRTYQPTRFEFAAALNACMERVAQLIAAGTVVSQADLSTLHQLESAYAVELAYLRRLVAKLEERTRRWEQQQAFEAELLATLRLPSVITNGVPVKSTPPVPPNLYAPANPTDVQAFLPLAKRTSRWEQQQAFEADLLATLKLPSTIKLSSEFLLKPQYSHIRTEPALPVPPNAGKSAALADFQALAPVMQRYGCTVGILDQFRAYKLTRLEFATVLNACATKVYELVLTSNSSPVKEADLLTLKQLEGTYYDEVGFLHGRVDALEARTR